jgi:hypothetical protein
MESRSGLRPFEKELPEQHPGSFRYTNTPIFYTPQSNEFITYIIGFCHTRLDHTVVFLSGY